MRAIIIGNFIYPYGSASASRLRNLASGFVKKGVSVQVISFHRPLAAQAQLDPGSNHRAIFTNRKYKQNWANKLIFGFQYFFAPFLFAFELVRLNPQKHSDFVYLYGRNFYLLFTIFLYCRLKKIKLVYDSVELPILQRGAGKILHPIHLDEYFGFKFYSKRAFLNVCISHSLHRYIKSDLKIVIPGTIADYRNRMPAPSPNGTCHFLYIGAFFDRDNPELLYSLVECLLKYPATIKIAGRFSSNKQSAYWIERLKALDADGRKIQFYDSISDTELRALCLQSHIFLLPRKNLRSETFAFPTRIIEYMQYNGVVLSNDLRDINKYFKDGNDILFIEDDLQKTVEKVYSLVSNRDAFGAVGARANKHLDHLFSAEVNASKILDHLHL